ncbi:MAG: protein kinase [Candidatus Binatia bacterium]
MGTETRSLDAKTLGLLAAARRGEKYALGRLISLAERDDASSRGHRIALFHHLAAHPTEFPHAARVVGFTGTPGAGKSTLIGALVLALLEQDPTVRVAVLAVDPSSQRSGGALLGDRLRTRFPVGEPRVFFRSQATRGDVGGLGRRTYAAARLLAHFFDLILIETVGIGQSEIEVTHLADLTILVLQPLAGDHVQFLKAGVMEVPDVFVVNKCDVDELARRSYHELRSALGVAKVEGGVEARIFQTSATTGRGIPELARFLGDLARAPQDAAGARRKAEFFLRKAVAERYGRFGVTELERHLGRLADGAVYEEVEAEALAAIEALVR